MSRRAGHNLENNSIALAHPDGALAVLCAATFMVLLDNSIVNVALPSIQQDLEFTRGGVQWVLIGYALPFGGFLLLGGRLGDLFGTRRVFVGGLVLFATASVIGGLAVTPWMLISARVLQGLGAAALSPSAMALVIFLFPQGPTRNRALGVYAATATLGITTGMILGGVLTDLGGWRWVMFVNVPVALAALMPALSVIPAQLAVRPWPRVDLAGAATVTLGLVGLLYALERATHTGWLDRGTLAVLAISAALLTAFAMIERRVPVPLLPSVLLRSHAIRTTATVMLLKSTVGIAALFIPTMYFQQVLGYSPLTSGLAFVPGGVACTVACLTGPRLIQRLGSPKAMIVLALSLQFAGLMLMSTMPHDHSPISMIVGIAVFLVGFLWTDVALNIALSLVVTDATCGAGTGIFRAAAQLGGAIGLGVIATLVAARAPGAFIGTVDTGSLIAGLRVGLWCGAVFAVAGLAVAIVGLRSRSRTSERTA